MAKHNWKHGLSSSNLYNRWNAMRNRCDNPNSPKYARYGGRGIKVCDRWTKFTGFLEDMGMPPFEGASLDRINTNGHYCKENCKWSDQKTQQNNRNNNRILLLNGELKTVSQWGHIYGIKPSLITQRIDRDKWETDRAITTPAGNATDLAFLRYLKEVTLS